MGAAWQDLSLAGNNNKAERTQVTRDQTNSTHLGEQVTMSCSFYAYPDSSADILWLVDYYALGERKSRAGKSEQQRYSLLYDSRLQLKQHQQQAQRHQQHNKMEDPNWFQIQLYEARLVVRESRSALQALQCANQEANSTSELAESNYIDSPDSMQPLFSVLKESQLVIQAAHADDSAR